MSTITFIYMKNHHEIKLQENETLLSAIKKYSINITRNFHELYFSYNGKNINNKINEISQMSGNRIITVFNLKRKINKTVSTNIICPECKSLALLNINDCKFSINNCINNHNCSDLTINELINSQMIDDSVIECDLCHNKKYLCDKFYICLCTKKVCSICSETHIDNKKHILIDYNNRFFKCNIHDKNFISYCSTCKINLCEKCEDKHRSHKIIIYKSELQNIKKLSGIRNELEGILLNINQYKKEIKKLNSIFIDFIINLDKDLEDYIQFYKNMVNCLNNLDNNIKNY